MEVEPVDLLVRLSLCILLYGCWRVIETFARQESYPVGAELWIETKQGLRELCTI